MKKFKNILLPLAMVLVIIFATACSVATKTKTFVKEENGVSTTLTYTYVESTDKVEKQATENVVMYSAFPNIKTKEDAEKIFEPIAKRFKGIKGLTHSVEYNDDQFIEKLEVDYKDFDYEKAKGLPGMNFGGNPNKAGVSMKKSEEMIKSQGFTEKK